MKYVRVDEDTLWCKEKGYLPIKYTTETHIVVNCFHDWNPLIKEGIPVQKILNVDLGIKFAVIKALYGMKD